MKKIISPLLRPATLSMWILVLVLGAALPTVAQETPTLKITPLWEITLPICPSDDSCYPSWKLSADGEHLFVYISSTSTMYVFAKGRNEVISYPNIKFHQTMNDYFDYFPLDDHVIFYSNITEGGILMRYDLQTGESGAFGVDRGLKRCLAPSFPSFAFVAPWDAFHYLYGIQELMVCRIPLDGTDESLISNVDLKTAEVTDVLRLGDLSYLNAVGGRDGTIYVEPGLGSYWSFIPQLRERWDDIRFVERWNPALSTWNTIEITSSDIKNEGQAYVRFFGVDQESNLYLISHMQTNLNFVITKVDANGKVVQEIAKNQLGWNPYLIGLDASGELIILNTIPLSGENTPIYIISRYEFETAIEK